MQLGFLPRMTVVHTAGREIGQIYMPLVNWALAALTLAAVIGFGSSDALAGAYGIAVSLLMANPRPLMWPHSWPYAMELQRLGSGTGQRQPAR